MLRRYFGDRAFLRRVLGFGIPILIQNGITTFVALLDNIMVGQVGTLQMSGVSVANQLIFIFNLCVFGANAGAGIFGAQFHGSGDKEGILHATRFKILMSLLLSIGAILLFNFCGPNLINLYLQGEGSAQDAAQTLTFGFEYMQIMLWGLVPFALTNVYATTMRECNRTMLPMVGSVVAVLTNLALNFVLIFGHFGLPAMGAKGAAVATVISRFVEFGILVIWSAFHKNEYDFFRGLYRSCYIPVKLFGRIMAKGMPLMVNEFMWSTGMAVLNQSYSTCGLAVVPAVNICETLNNIASVGVIALGHTVGILMGQMMGAGCSREEIKDSNNKIIRIGLVIGVVFGSLMALGAPLFPHLYQVDGDIRSLASQLMLVLAVMKPVMAFLYCTYFSIRSGGKTWTTFFFDCGILWCFTVPLSVVLSRMTDIPILLLFICCQLVDIAKCFIGYYLLKKGTWIQNLAK